MTSTVIATRGMRLALTSLHGSFRGRDGADVLSIVEIDGENRVVGGVVFDPDDFHAAIAELEARYVAGEAAAYAHTWSVITRGHAAVNRQELPSMTPDCVSIDHRRGATFASGALTEYFRAGWDLGHNVRTYVEVVHVLSELGAVCTHVGHGVSREGFDAEWRGVDLLTVEGDMVNRCEVFEEADLDAALVRFDEFSSPATRSENAASRVLEHFLAHFEARDWAAMAEMVVDSYLTDDRRQAVNAGTRQGRDPALEEIRAAADVGFMNATSNVIATRGAHLALVVVRFASHEQRLEPFQIEHLLVAEISAEARMAAVVVFDLDDINAAFKELDARYVAGEAAAHSRTWSIITQMYAELNRHELPRVTPNWANVDHRRGTNFAPGDLLEYLRAGWDLHQDINYYIETVHRLSDVGTVVTHAVQGRSQEGFAAEWRMIELLTVDGDLVNRCELFDEIDLDVALERFEQLHPQAPPLENAASRVAQRFSMLFAARDFDAMADILADNYSGDDRRRVVGAGVRHGRDAQIAAMRTTADLWITSVTTTVVATRGKRLALLRGRFSDPDQTPEAYLTELLGVFEINADERIVALVSFDLDNVDAAFDELNARYVAGEAAPYARVWHLGMDTIGELNRHEPGPMISRLAYADHRRLPFTSGEDFRRWTEELWTLVPDARYRVKAVHALDAHGSVSTLGIEGTDAHGNELHWGRIILFAAGEPRVEVYEEDDVDAALARFEELRPQAPRPENAASHVIERFQACFASRDWTAMADLLAADIATDDRRPVVSTGIQHSRDVAIANMRAVADIGVTNMTSTVIATRGDRLTLSRARMTGRDQRPEAFQTDVLDIVEIDADNRMAAHIAFDADDIDAAFDELETRYLAGEAASHAHTWKIVSGAYAAMNRRELFATTSDWTNADRRRHAIIDEGGLNASLRSLWELMPDLTFRVEAVHRLTDLGAVCTHVGHGTSRDGFDAEWRGVEVMTVDGDLIGHCEIFDEADLDAALARFDELHRDARRLENGASLVEQRFNACFAARDWAAMTELLSDDILMDDRRRIVNAGVRRGRDAEIASERAVAEVGVTNYTRTVIAIRGQRLVLSRYSISDGWSGSQVLCVSEINAENHFVARVAFDPDDIDAAFAELDARYLAGEAAAHSHAWSVIAGLYAGFNRHELPAITPDFSYVDHRPVITIAETDLPASIRAVWELTPDISIYMETVHRLTDLGAVVTHTARGVSHEDFDAEWRMIDMFTVEGDLISRCEMFDEADLDAALARFDELQAPTRRLENAATRAGERFFEHFRARNWGAVAENLTDDSCVDDRRRVVNAGFWGGRDVVIANMRPLAGGWTNLAMTAIATRGERLALARICSSNPDPRYGEFDVEMLVIVEIDTDERITAQVLFGADDFAAAFAELDTRYVAGEAAVHLDTWSVIAEVRARFNRHELPATTPDPVYIDHRPLVSIEGVELAASIRAVWDLTSDASVYIEAVHRLSESGAVITEVLKMTSQEGFDAELRMIFMFTVEGDLISRVEVFAEADVDAALSRFEELQPPARRLENKATRIADCFFANVQARNWAAIAEIMAQDSCIDDRRRVVNGGLWDGRDVVIANMRAIGVGGANITWSVIATRGERLALTRICSSNLGLGHGEFENEMLGIAEIDADDRMTANVLFDPDDFDAAFEELDARFVAGEAAPYAHTWSVNSGLCAGFNRHELPATTPDWVYIDHRPLITIEASDLHASVQAVWDLTPHPRTYIEAVHRLNNLGGVVTSVVYGTSHDGFDAEWRTIDLFTVDGDLVNRCEIFDETDLDAALTRFDELQPSARRLENKATRAEDRFFAYYKARDWAAIAEMLADGSFIESRVRVVNTGLWEGRDVVIANMRALADAVANTTSAVVAIRGERLALSRMRYPNSDPRYGEFAPEQLIIAEIDTDDRFAAHIVFDPEDMDAAIAELDARYIAGEAARYSHTWSVLTQNFAAFNRHEIPSMTVDPVYIDHRPVVAVEGVGLAAAMHAVWDLTPDIRFCLEAVHRLSDLGAVVTGVTKGTSPEGFAAEWHMINVIAVEGDRISRYEVFDETEVAKALTRFEGLHPPARPLENAASRAHARLKACVTAREWHALTEILADDIAIDDRRRVVNSGIQYGRDAAIADMRGAIDLGLTNISLTVIATRGDRLALSRMCIGGEDQPVAFRIEFLSIVEVDADERIAARVAFDPEDINAAFEELDARYLAGEAADHAHTWSVIARIGAAFNRHEILAADWVTIDHRLLTIDESYSATTFRSAWDLTPNLHIHIEAVHRLSSFGAVVTYTAYGTSPEGFDAEWRMIQLLTVEGDLINRCEIFDEADLDAALARFAELHPQAPRLENAASRADKRLTAYVADRDWDAMAEMLADDYYIDDRHPVVNVGLRRGRDLAIAGVQTFTDLGITLVLSDAIATRGDRLALSRARWQWSGPDQLPEAFHTEVLNIVEINADERIVARIWLDANDIDAAFAELDARYLAGEAADHAHTWSVIARECATFNGRELPAADWVTIDHRQLAVIDATEGQAAMRAIWDVTPDLGIRIEAVHRLASHGTLATYTAYGTSPQGFTAEWQMILLLTVEGDGIDRCEIFDETDLDAALARFDELHQQARRSENAASLVAERYQMCFSARDWDTMAELLADDIVAEDRRRVVNAGIRHGRDVYIADIQAAVEVGAESITSTVVATRGERLVLARVRSMNRGWLPGEFGAEMLGILEIDADNRMAAVLVFDIDDVDAAFEELDARYLAGEAAGHAHTWSVIARECASFNRHEHTAADYVTIDHRQLAIIDASDLQAAIRATWDVTPDFSIHIEAVHRLSSFGAVATYSAHGASPEGFDAEWRMIQLLAVEGDLINRCEIFDEADLDAALAKFDELSPPMPLLGNAGE